MKKALLFDLDNTIYPVSAIADNLFGKLFRLLDENAALINGNDHERVTRIKDEMTRKPFQHIADQYELDKNVRNKMIGALRNMTYDLPMQPFEDYHKLRKVLPEKFLVTTGFRKLQYSKIKQLGIEKDFKEIFIVDPDVSNQTKKHVFAGIMGKYHFEPGDLLVIGDDPDSEIKAALELGIDTFLFDPAGTHPQALSTYRSSSLVDVLSLL